jgi:multiple sugar transport system permease protein
MMAQSLAAPSRAEASRFNTRNLLLHLVIIGFGLLMLYPIAWLFSSSIKPSYLIFTDTGLWPAEVTLENYIMGWQGVARVHFSRFMLNSTLVSILAVAGNIVACSLAAYAFARINFLFKGILFALMLVTIMLPYHVTVIPQYMLFRNFDWIDSYFPMVIPKWLATDAFFIFLLVQFYRGIPRELDEAARLDGCNHFQIFSRIIVPLSTPALVTTMLFTFIWTWNDFFTQLLYLNTAHLFTVPLGLRLFMDSSATSAWGPLFAMSVVSLLPSLILFFSLQKYFVEGIATTGLKG